MSHSITIVSKTTGETFSFESTSSINIDFRHSKSHTARLRVSDPQNQLINAKLGDATIKHNGTTFLEGTITKIRPQKEETELVVEGPTWHLKRQGPQSAPTPVTYSNETVSTAIRDYASLRGLDITVNDPKTDIQKDGSNPQQSNSFNTFANIFNVPSTEPVVTDGNTSMRVAKTCYVNATASTWGDNYDLLTDANGGYISGVYARLTDPALHEINATVTPEYDIPSERVGVAVSVSFTGSGSAASSVIFNGDQLSSSVFTGTQEGADWYSFENYSGPDLLAGQERLIEVDLNSQDIDLEIDAVALYDTKYKPTHWEEPTSSTDTIRGPEWYPNSVTLTTDSISETWNIVSATVDATVNNTSAEYQYRGTVDNSNYLTISNQADGTFNFKSNDYYGTTLTIELTFGGWDNNDVAQQLGPRPTIDNDYQELTKWEVSVTTDTTPIIGDISLEGNDYENLKSLIDKGGARFVTDPTVEPPQINVFWPDNPDVAKTPDWNQISYPQAEFNLTGYANRATAINGDANAQVTVQNNQEVDEYGVIESPPIYTDATGDQLGIVAQREVIKRSNNDQPEAEIEIMPELVLPGYPYQLDFGLSALDTARYSVEASDTASMTLQFGQPDTPVQRLIETRQNLQ